MKKPLKSVGLHTHKKKFGVAFSYYNEPFKTAAAVKEMINLKSEIDKNVTTKIKKCYLK